jgi:hypothetical protein
MASRPCNGLLALDTVKHRVQRFYRQEGSFLLVLNTTGKGVAKCDTPPAAA